MKTFLKLAARFFLFNIGWTVVWNLTMQNDRPFWWAFSVTFSCAVMFVASIEYLAKKG